MNELQQLIDLTEKGLMQVATQLGTTLPQLWEIMIRQQYVEAVQAFVFLGICSIIAKIAYKKRKALSKSMFFDDDTPMCLIGYFVTIFFVIIFIIAIIDGFSGAGQLINPEYYAIKDIVSQIGTLTNK